MALPKTTILLLLLLALSAAEDYYEILGIGKDADNRQIRKVSKDSPRCKEDVQRVQFWIFTSSRPSRSLR